MDRFSLNMYREMEKTLNGSWVRTEDAQSEIAELEAKVDALRFSLDEVGTRNLKADATNSTKLST